MLVVDSNTWGDFFNGVESPYVGRLETALLGEEDVAILPIILTEVLQGFRSVHGFRRARHIMTSLPVIRGELERYVRAAELFRFLRSKGVTVRGAVDCCIAQTCLDLAVELLSPDRDFREISAHTDLRLWVP